MQGGMTPNTNPAATASTGIPIWKRVLRSPSPVMGVEISSAGISVARWGTNSPRFETITFRPFSAGALEVSPLAENIREPEEVRRAMEAALVPFGRGSRDASQRQPEDIILVIPDQAAKLFVLSFEVLPQKPLDALGMVKWRLKKSVPFDIESAAVSFFAQPSGGQWQVAAVATSRAVIRQYEELAAAFGLQARNITLSTLAALELLPEGRLGGATSSSNAVNQLVAKYSPPWLTIVIMQGEFLRLFRTLSLTSGNSGSISAEEVLEALVPSLAYFQDTFSANLDRVYLCGMGGMTHAGETGAHVAEALAKELQITAQPLVDSVPGSVEMDSHLTERNFSGLMGMAQGQARSR